MKRAAALCLLAGLAPAQELPVRVWGVRDGLVQSRVNDIERDSLGYVWFATWEGVSRFDGRRFVDWGAREGLPNPLVWCVAEDRAGRIWLGTHGGGLAQVAATGAAVLTTPPGPSNPSERVFEIAFDRDARTWIVTDQGLFVSEDVAPKRFTRIAALAPDWFGRPFVDPQGELWFIGSDEVVRCDGGEVACSPLPREELGELRSVAARSAGGCWVTHVRSLHVLELPRADRAAERRVQAIDFGPNTSLYDACEDTAGRLWIGTSRGLLRVDGDEQRWFGSAQGLPDDWVHALSYDDRGGLWIGTHHGGAALLPDSGIERYTQRSGLGDGNAVKLVPLDDERWLVATEVAGLFALDRGRASAVAHSDRPPFDRIQHNLLRDLAGDWWIGTGAGLFRARGPELDLSRAQQVGADQGLPAAVTSVLGLDPHGAVLVSGAAGKVFLQEPGSVRFRALPFALPNGDASYYAFDAHGALWLGNHEELWRWRGGRLEEIDPRPQSNEPLQPRSLLADSRGWLWVGTRFGGVAYTREPEADAPAFELVTTRDGLASDTVFALAEDRAGALYFGTGRGVHRYLPSAGVLELIGPSEGLAGEWVTDLELDARGDVWVAASGGVSRIRLGEQRPRGAPPRVRFTRCVVAGEELALPAPGVLDVAALEIGAGDSRLAFEFVAVDPVDGERWRYQTRLAGLDDAWSEPTRELSARYGRLAAGDYQFLVRCVDASASVEGEASGIAIDVLPPLWARWWVIALAAASAGALAFGLHRVRLQRALALERLRTQIATDLHDDLGAGLAQIAILSEVAKRADGDEARNVMGEVAGVARSLRGAMSELVWAVDPRRDTLADLASRMRQFAGDVFSGDGLALEIRTPPEPELAAVELAPDCRRGLYLFFKEALTNVARHAHAAHVEVELSLAARELTLVIRDDGRGFDPTGARTGHGLDNLRRRAQQLDGGLEIDTAPGAGTCIRLRCPARPA